MSDDAEGAQQPTVAHLEPGGSIWRRWDPHVHLPGTLFEDNFGDTSIAEALDVLASCKPPIEVVGVTDYFTTRSFRTAHEAWVAGSGSSIKLLFPNVELRLDVVTRKDYPVNLHLMCSAEDVNELDRFLGTLSFTFGGSEYRITDQNLIALGRAVREKPALDEQVALREGAHQFKISFEELYEKYSKNTWALHNCIIAVAGGEDGSSGVRSSNGSFEGRRRTIEELAHAIFTGNPNQATYWSGEGVDDLETLNRRYGGRKLCIHGSDAHSAESLGKPDLDRFTWLKGNASFETLRMACLAPETRSHVGSTSPFEGSGYGRISKLTVRNGTWFTPGSIPINPGLVAIIGPRGSGKTALADLIAAGAGSTQLFGNPSSFVLRADSLLMGSTSEVEWTQGDVTDCTFGAVNDRDENAERPVRYLSQQFVEKLCAGDGISTDLISEIERVVFNTWPIEQRQGATNFNELLDIRLQSARTRQSAELDAVAALSEAITDQRNIKAGLPAKSTELANHEKQLEAIIAQAKDLTGKANAVDADRLEVLNDALQRRRQELQTVDRKITELESLRGEVKVARDSRFPDYVRRLRSEHTNSALTEADWERFEVDFIGDVDDVLATSIETTGVNRNRIAGTTSSEQVASNLEGLALDKLLERTVAELNTERERLQKLIGLDKERTKQLAKVNERAATVRAIITKLNAEIVFGQNADVQAELLTTERLERYASYFNALLEEKAQLDELYAPLSRLIANFGTSVAKLNFSVKRSVDISKWAKRGEALLDLRVAGPFRGSGELGRVATEMLLPSWESGDGKSAADAIQQFSSRHSSDIRQQALVDSGNPEDLRQWERNVSRWIYGADHVSLSYSLAYDGLNIERLSPGSRGIVLLLLYLAVDQEESDPLIIDQPEENLDPMSVFSELVGLFRSASYRRQIIMVTHNANLVVNTDVDQVIVAHCGELEEGRLPNFSYTLGGLEDPAIRKQVCDVLEGGEDAFLQRARRMQLIPM